MQATAYPTNEKHTDTPNIHDVATSLAVGLIITVMIILLLFVATRVVQHNNALANDVDDILDTVQKFHLAPSREAFVMVFDNRNILPPVVTHCLKHWVWGVESTHPTYLSDHHRRSLDLWRPTVMHDIYVAKSTSPTREALRCMWYIYFATGDQQYAEVVRRAAVIRPVGTIRDDKSEPRCSSIVRMYARSTYENIMKRDHDSPIMGTALDIAPADTHTTTGASTMPSVGNEPVHLPTSSTDIAPPAATVHG